MKMNKFTIGAISGIAALSLAVPLIAQISSAATSSAATTFGAPFKHAIPTQQQVQDMAAKDAAFLSTIDALVTVQKSAIQAHEAALTAAAAITDDTQRDAAVKKAQTDLFTTMQAAMTSNPNLKFAMMPFGGGRGFGEGRGGSGMMGRGPNQADLAAKLGMTESELKAALDSGKTIQQIATEKGVTLPTPSRGEEGRGPDTAKLATKLGMTEAELKAALDSGKTIQQIATEKGITLPAGKGKGGKHGGWQGLKGTVETGSASSAQ